MPSRGNRKGVILRVLKNHPVNSALLGPRKNTPYAELGIRVIYSQAFVPAPLTTGYISRLVQISVTNPIAFSKAIAAKGVVSFGGSGSVVDSFDSSNTNYSTGGKYDITKRRGNGGIVTDSTAAPAIAVGNAHVYGVTDTGPGGTVTVQGAGTV